MKAILLTIFLTYAIGIPYQQLSRENPKPIPEGKVESVSTYRPEPTPTPKTNKTLASWYDRSACAGRVYGETCKTANGEIFDETGYTAACSSDFRLGSHIRVCHLGKCIEIVCNDRGGFESLGRKFDLSPHAFSSLDDLSRGVISVEYERIK